MQKIVQRLNRHLARISNCYPNVWRKIDEYREKRGETLPDWSSCCFLPVDYAEEIVEESLNGQLSPLHHFEPLGLVGLSGWRATQGIYEFDPTIYQAVCSTPISGKLPVEVFDYLPECSSYILTPNLVINGLDIKGFFVYLTESTKTRQKELCFAIDTKINHQEGLGIISLNLNYATLEKAFKAHLKKEFDVCAQLGINIKDPTPQEITWLADQFAPLVSLTLYLCTETRELRDANGTNKQPARPQPTKTRRNGTRLFPAQRATVWQVAYRLGVELRAKAKSMNCFAGGSTGTHARMRPHFRRAHWSHYWIGKRSAPQERQLIAKWLPPSFINVSKSDDLVPVIKAVAA